MSPKNVFGPVHPSRQADGHGSQVPRLTSLYVLSAHDLTEEKKSKLKIPIVKINMYSPIPVA